MERLLWSNTSKYFTIQPDLRVVVEICSADSVEPEPHRAICEEWLPYSTVTADDPALEIVCNGLKDSDFAFLVLVRHDVKR
jgi:hypothetical protein